MKSLLTLFLSLLFVGTTFAQDEGVALPLDLPAPMFKGTPVPAKGIPHLRKPRGKARPAFLAPKGTVNLAEGKEVTGSDDFPVIGELEMVTDDDKDGAEGSYVELGPLSQWVQIDLEEPANIYAVVFWHYHSQARVYHDVILQVADDEDFVTNVRTLFNNDHDNSSKLGVGKDSAYVETNEGELIDCKGEKARYVRMYSRGNSTDEMNHYVEIAVYGKPATDAPESKPAKGKKPGKDGAAKTKKPGKDKKPGKKAGAAKTAPAKAAGAGVALQLDLPAPMFKGTPVPAKGIPHLRKPRGKARPAFLAPEGTTNLAEGKEVTGSDDFPVIGELEMVTDDDKDGAEGSYVELGPLTQWVQIDLGAPADIYAVVFWHYHSQARVYHDVILQVADDEDFVTNVRTLFNNDHDNSSKLGVGKDSAYVETNEGELIDCKGEKAQYVRMYSRGNSTDEMNHYVEIAVYGKPAK